MYAVMKCGSAKPSDTHQTELDKMQNSIREPSKNGVFPTSSALFVRLKRMSPFLSKYCCFDSGK
jgi:hypothetical protein